MRTNFSYSAAKLTPAAVRAIRQHANAVANWDVLGHRYGVSRWTIRDVLAGKTWPDTTSVPKPLEVATDHLRRARELTSVNNFPAADEQIALAVEILGGVK